MMHNYRSIPKKQGLYDPAHEHDACDVGFVVNIQGERSHDIVVKGLQVLDNLTHRGACGCDPLTGDGAGVLMQIPHEFFVKESEKLGFGLPCAGEYGVGMVFMPLDAQKRRACEEIFERLIHKTEQLFLGWLPVPIYKTHSSAIALHAIPLVTK